ncbi:hypothetical protein BU17DRAFT_67260 [Hysterangium stoloniferum]|nr:hypothetical protein BU17DRAFT_67260 [Hysterangium stoloniferum]
MLVRPALLLLSALSLVSSWPIFFYDEPGCNHYPVLTLEGPPHYSPSECDVVRHVDIRSYSGGTKDNIQKLLLYTDPELCVLDSAHHAYANHTITNATTTCHTFYHLKETPRAFVFIEEILGPIVNSYIKDPSSKAQDDYCHKCNSKVQID